MKLSSLSRQYQVHKIQESDIAPVYELCKGNSLYYQHCGCTASIDAVREDMQALPPGKKSEDKYYIGFYDNNQLLAVMDLIEGYPCEDTVYIGFFMVGQKFQKCGIGTKIIQELLLSCKAKGFLNIKLGYVKGNLQSEHFWLKNHFSKTGQETHTEKYIAVEMQCTLND